MTTPIETGPPLRLTKDEKKKVGSIFKSWFERVDDERRARFKKIWAKALDNFEGQAPTRTFPWVGASNAFLPLTGAFSDTFQSRLYASATAQTPVFLLQQPTGGNALIKEDTGLDVTVETFVEWWQRISEWIETTQIGWNDVAEDLTYTVVLYGDAYLRPSWVEEKVLDVTLDRKGKRVETERTLYEGVRIFIHHPRDIYTEWDENDPQQARKIAVSFLLDLTELEEFAARGDYSKDDVEELKKRILKKEADNKRDRLRQLGGPNHFKEWETGEFMTPDEFERELKKKAELDPEAGPGQVRLYRVYARVDLNNKGIPAEVIFDTTGDGMVIPWARFDSSPHKQRPLIHYYFSRRPGVAYNRGIPEILFNIQKIANRLIRDELDNATVQNTNVFVARAGSGIKEQDRIFPNRLFLLKDPKDLQAVKLGAGSSVRGLDLLGLLQSMSQLSVGLTDFNLGQEKRSRTPAGTTKALLEEATKRIDRTIDQARTQSKKAWFQVLMLYFQHGNADDLARIATADPDEQKDFAIIHESLNPEKFRRMLVINPQVSSNSLNRSTKLQESLAKFAQLDQFYQKLLAIANLVGTTQADPVLNELAKQMAIGYHRAWGDVLENMDEKDQEAFNPDVLLDLVKGVESAVPGIDQGVAGSPAEAAQAVLSGGTGESSPEQNPAQTVPGGTRNPVDSFGVQSPGGGA